VAAWSAAFSQGPRPVPYRLCTWQCGGRWVHWRSAELEYRHQLHTQSLPFASSAPYLRTELRSKAAPTPKLSALCSLQLLGRGRPTDPARSREELEGLPCPCGFTSSGPQSPLVWRRQCTDLHNGNARACARHSMDLRAARVLAESRSAGGHRVLAFIQGAAIVPSMWRAPARLPVIACIGLILHTAAGAHKHRWPGG